MSKPPQKERPEPVTNDLASDSAPVPVKDGTLYIVATPIGNLSDFSDRARAILEAVGLIAAEDTRHSAKLLHHFNIKTPLISLHEYNEVERSQALINKLIGGESIALISDAGTPLISDPGYVLVRQCHDAGLPVVPIPGPCAAITALSAAGLPTDSFVFEGFPSSKSGARKEGFRKLSLEPRTLIFYESSHRILACLADMLEIFGDRRAVIARELTKRFETIKADRISRLIEWIELDEHQKLGEFVIILAGADASEISEAQSGKAEHLLKTFLLECAPGLPLSQAVSLVVELTGLKKNLVYEMALAVSKQGN